MRDQCPICGQFPDQNGFGYFVEHALPHGHGRCEGSGKVADRHRRENIELWAEVTELRAEVQAIKRR